MNEYNFEGATSRDLSRQAATLSDTGYTLSLDEVAERYARAGHARTMRSLQRYCANGYLDARKIATATGDKYLVTPQSVGRHIAEIIELAEINPGVATIRDTSRPVATEMSSAIPAAAPMPAASFEPERANAQPVSQPVAPSTAQDEDTPYREPVANGRDLRRQVATADTTQTAIEAPETHSDRSGTPRQAATETAGETTRYVAQLERQLEAVRDERDFLREQIDRKDRTIEALIERDRETNFLVRGLQEMLTPLLGGRRQDMREDHQAR